MYDNNGRGNDCQCFFAPDKIQKSCCFQKQKQYNSLEFRICVREETNMKSLIAYFSRADENYFGGQLKYIQK